MKRKNNIPAVSFLELLVPNRRVHDKFDTQYSFSCGEGRDEAIEKVDLSYAPNRGNYKKIFFLFALLYSIAGLSQTVDLEEETCNCPGGSKKGKGTFYASWGYNLDWYSKSDIHFRNSGTDNYDFTLYKVRAKDRPGFDQIISWEITVPQYVYRLGYYFNDKHDMGVEFNFDHSKYVMVQDQTVRIKGQIHDQILDKDTILGTDFLKFEHTNGANFMMGNFLKRINFYHSADKKHWLSAVAKFGAGIVIPKTDVTLFGNQLDNRFHIAGWIAGSETGIRYDGFKHFFAEATLKGTFANYSDVLVIGTGKASHSFWTGQLILNAGFQFGW